jgi:hypothetical protein
MFRDNIDVLGWGELNIIPEDAELFQQMLQVGRDAHDIKLAEKLSTKLWDEALKGDLPKPEVLVSIMHFDTDSEHVTMDNGEPITSDQYVFSIDLDGYTLTLGGNTVSFHERLYFSTREALDAFLQAHNFEKMPYSVELRERIARKNSYRIQMRDVFDSLKDDDNDCTPSPEELESVLFDYISSSPEVSEAFEDFPFLEEDIPEDQLN